MRAELKWVPSADGGRTLLPTGNRYVTVAQIVSQKLRSRDEIVGDWSMVVISSPSPREQGLITFCDVSFLAPNAPHHELASGVSFRLQEGAKTVANGVIL